MSPRRTAATRLRRTAALGVASLAAAVSLAALTTAPAAGAATAIPSHGSPTQLDVGNWNVEWFGSPDFGPTDEALQQQNVREVMAGADMDVWGLSEVVSTSAFNQLVAGMPGYTGVVANDPIVTNGAQYYSDFNDTEQKVALVWRSSMATLVSAKVILTAQNSNFAGRPPVEFTLRGTFDGVTRDLVFIVLHAKSGATQDAWNLRNPASQALKSYLDTTYPTQNVFVIGDWNDDVDTSITPQKASPYANFVSDAARYTFPTRALSLAGVPSTADYPDFIDHQLTTDEVQAKYVAGSATAFQPQAYIPNYATTTSDHYPVLARYNFLLGGGGGNGPANVMINEVLANEPGSNTAGEAVELVNTGSTAADLTGWTLSDGSAVRHTFAAGTTLQPGKAITVFGASSAIPAGITAVGASTGGLNLSNSGDTVTLRDSTGATVQSLSYTSGQANSDGVSINRNPDGSATGSWVKHDTISSLPSSPGRRADGTAY
ncbi:lamin tail domain-containing protein [Streptomyces sp. NPDC089919]|uniref:lamin tail domain-containing protein n=1 Tax=Streptomyces sp. NPDC089919 TaxID=3155188 RepID=UPI00343A9DC6